MAADGERRAPLEGLRVLDMSQAMSGPYAGRILSDLGADVVKVEWPNGDVANYFGETRDGVSGLFTHLNAGKRGIAVDFGTPSGKHLIHQLCARADVVIENFRPGVLDRAGLGYEQLVSAQQALVMLSISGFGRSSPEAGRMAFAPVIHAESGLLSRQAQFDATLAFPDLALSIADVLAGIHGAVAVLAALTLRWTTGRGQHIDMSMLEAMVASDDYVHYALDAADHASSQRGEVWDAPGGPLMIAADPRMLWVRLRDGAGLVDAVGTDVPLEERIAHRRQLVRDWIDSFGTREALIGALEGAGLAWADVRTMSNLLESPTLAASGVVMDVPDGRGGERRVMRMPYRFSDANCTVRGPAPVAGQHAREVLCEWLELRAEEVAGLFEDGALIDRPRIGAAP